MWFRNESYGLGGEPPRKPAPAAEAQNRPLARLALAQLVVYMLPRRRPHPAAPRRERHWLWWAALAVFIGAFDLATL